MKKVGVTSLLLFVLGLTFPSIVMQVGDEHFEFYSEFLSSDDVASLDTDAFEVYKGWELLILGWLPLVMFELGAVGWLANPLYIYLVASALLRNRIQWKVLVAASVLCLIALPMLRLFPLPADEGVVQYQHLESFGAGYLFWCAAIAAFWWPSTRRTLSSWGLTGRSS